VATKTVVAVAVASARVQEALEVTAAVDVGIIIMFLLSTGSGGKKGDGGGCSGYCCCGYLPSYALIFRRILAAPLSGPYQTVQSFRVIDKNKARV